MRAAGTRTPSLRVGCPTAQGHAEEGTLGACRAALPPRSSASRASPGFGQQAPERGARRAQPLLPAAGGSPGGAERWAERLSKGDVPHQAALTHLGFWLKLHLHLLPARGEKHRERGQSGKGPGPFPMAAPPPTTGRAPTAPACKPSIRLVPNLLSIRRMPTVNRTTANTSPPILRLW